MTRIALILALGLAGGSALAQTVPARRQAPDAALRGSAPIRPDPEIEAARQRSEARLRGREDKARQTLRGICQGC